MQTPRAPRRSTSHLIFGAKRVYLGKGSNGNNVPGNWLLSVFGHLLAPSKPIVGLRGLSMQSSPLPKELLTFLLFMTVW
jgi:hypothetical protein